MTEIVRSAGAGTMESSDVYVEIEPGQAGIELRLESVVKGQLGPAIEEVVREVLDQCGSSGCSASQPAIGVPSSALGHRSVPTPQPQAEGWPRAASCSPQAGITAPRLAQSPHVSPWYCSVLSVV